MSLPTPYYHTPDGAITLYCGDCREILPEIEPGSVDLVLTDPPYSSGGAMRSDRNQSTRTKYQFSGIDNVCPTFSGDNRDQRSFERWCYYWMADCLAVTTAGGALLSFIDWRNLPVLVDAIQIAGWVYRAIVPWDKGEGARPQMGWFRAQCEYIVAGSAGALSRDHTSEDSPGICAPGLYRANTVTGPARVHATEKPVSLIQKIIETRHDWQTILDPFAGSGTTLLAARNLGRRAIGIEISEEYCEIAAGRLGAVHAAKETEPLLSLMQATKENAR